VVPLFPSELSKHIIFSAATLSLCLIRVLEMVTMGNQATIIISNHTIAAYSLVYNNNNDGTREGDI
jgi:hypothetical protein